jgi:hypothetical protein
MARGKLKTAGLYRPKAIQVVALTRGHMQKE